MIDGSGVSFLKGLDASKAATSGKMFRPKSAMVRHDQDNGSLSPKPWRFLAAAPDAEEIKAATSPLALLNSTSGDMRPVSAPPMRIDLFESSLPNTSSSRKQSTVSNTGFSRRVPVSMVALLATSVNSRDSKFVASKASSSASSDVKPQWKTLGSGHIAVPRSAKLENKDPKRETDLSQKRTKEVHFGAHMKPRTSVHTAELENNAIFIHNLPLFGDLPRDRLMAVAASMKKQHCVFGTVLIRQGRPASKISIVVSGQVSVERNMYDGGKHNGILSSCLKKPSKSTAESPASVKVQTALTGSVFGDFALLFDKNANETASVESISGAEILSVSLSDLKEHLDAAQLASMKERARDAAHFRQDQAHRVSYIMTSAVHKYASRPALFVPYPSQDELKKISRRMRQDTWHPIGWRNKQQQIAASPSRPPRPQSAPPAPSLQSTAPGPPSKGGSALSLLPEGAALRPHVGHSRPGPPHAARPSSAASQRSDRVHGPGQSTGTTQETGRGKLEVHKERERPASAGPRVTTAAASGPGRDDDDSSSVATLAVGGNLKRPASALAAARKKWESGPPVWEANKYGECQDINYRKLFLSTWDLPERHTVYTGAKIAVSAAAATEVPHVELDIDALEDLEGTYLATFQ